MTKTGTSGINKCCCGHENKLYGLVDGAERFQRDTDDHIISSQCKPNYINICLLK